MWVPNKRTFNLNTFNMDICYQGDNTEQPTCFGGSTISSFFRAWIWWIYWTTLDWHNYQGLSVCCIRNWMWQRSVYQWIHMKACIPNPSDTEVVEHLQAFITSDRDHSTLLLSGLWCQFRGITEITIIDHTPTACSHRCLAEKLQYCSHQRGEETKKVFPPACSRPMTSPLCRESYLIGAQGLLLKVKLFTLLQYLITSEIYLYALVNWL